MGVRPGRAQPPRLALITAIVIALAALPFVYSDAYLLKVLSFVGINVIIVAGLSLLFGYAGQVSLGHAAFYGIGAYTSGVLAVRFGWPWIACVAAAVVVSAIGGLILAVPTLRLKGHYLAMATLAFGQIAYVAFVEAKGITGGIDGLSGIPSPSLGPLQLRSAESNYLLVWFFVGVALLLAGNIVALRPGRALRALHASEAGAQACGIDVVRTKVQVFVVSASLAGLAGSLFAHLVGFISPSSFTLVLSIELVAMVVLGGMGSLAGAALGAVVLTLIPNLDAVIPGMSPRAVELLQDWNADIFGVILIVVMLFMPGGLAAGARRLAARVRERRFGPSEAEA
jgi:branched-chain amino acid transport system permease protein